MDDPFLAAGEGPGNVVLDVDGVLVLEGHPVPGAGVTIQELREQGRRLLFATNNSTRTAAGLAEALTETLSTPVDASEVVTSSIAALAMLESEDAPILVVGERGLEDTLAGGGHALTARWEDANAVVVGLDRGIDYARLSAATRAVRAGARFVGTNGDSTFPVRGGQIPGAGAIIAAVAAAGGREPEIAGKPHSPMRDAIRHRLGPGHTWMVGDRAETDLAMAAAEGWSAVLVLTGVTAHPDDLPRDIAPDLVLESVADLVDAIGEVQ